MSLSQERLNYVLTQERKGWHVASKVASLADVHVNKRVTVVGQKMPEGKSAKVATAVTSDETRAGHSFKGGHKGHFQSGRGGSGGHQSSNQAQIIKCYKCNEFRHISRYCP